MKKRWKTFSFSSSFGFRSHFFTTGKISPSGPLGRLDLALVPEVLAHPPCSAPGTPPSPAHFPPNHLTRTYEERNIWWTIARYHSYSLRLYYSRQRYRLEFQLSWKISDSSKKEPHPEYLFRLIIVSPHWAIFLKRSSCSELCCVSGPAWQPNLEGRLRSRGGKKVKLAGAQERKKPKSRSLKNRLNFCEEKGWMKPMYSNNFDLCNPQSLLGLGKRQSVIDCND